MPDHRQGERVAPRRPDLIETDLGQEPTPRCPGAGGPNPRGHRLTTAPRCIRELTQLIRAGTDPVLVADLLGHASLDTVALYSRPTDHDREQALAHLTTDG